MPEVIRIETTQNVELQLQVAPLGDRVIACIVDSLIRAAGMFVMFIVLAMIAPNAWSDDIAVILMVIVLIPVIFYHLLFEILNHGQSPGKKMFNLRVMSLRGESVSLGAYFLRWIFRLVDFQIFSGLVALIAVASSRKGQRIGDMVAGTTVVKEQPEVQFNQLAYEMKRPEYEATYLNAYLLKPEHIALIKETLDNFALQNSETLVRVLADKTASMLGAQYDDHPRKFLRTVVRDYSETSRLRGLSTRS